MHHGSEFTFPVGMSSCDFSQQLQKYNLEVAWEQACLCPDHMALYVSWAKGIQVLSTCILSYYKIGKTF